MTLKWPITVSEICWKASLHLLHLGWTVVIQYFHVAWKTPLKAPQLIQNAAARVLTGTTKREYFSYISALHWLLVKIRIEFKIIFRFKILNNQALSYLKDLIILQIYHIIYHPMKALCSQTAGYLWFLELLKAGRAFSCKDPFPRNHFTIWIQKTDTINIKLKTLILDKAYS